jgi:hypothetical protein
MREYLSSRVEVGILVGIIGISTYREPLVHGSPCTWSPLVHVAEGPIAHVDRQAILDKLYLLE